MTKRILSAMMCAVILFSLTEVSGAYATSPEFDLPETDTGYIEEVTGTDENEIVDYIDENVDVILLPEDGSMPDYIKYAEFDDGSIYIADGYGDVSEIPDQADEAWDDDMIPIKFPPLSAEGAFESTGIELCADIDTAPVHIQIYDDENDVSVFDADFPILESEIITLIEDKEYSISLVFDYGDFARGYYGSISVIDGNVEELGAWEITTERVVPDDVDSAVESYDSIVNEREPNNSYGSATNYKNNDDMYGTISSASDVDYYKVDFGRDGKANFYLGNIPEDCNYDLKIYSQPVSGGTPVLYRTLSTSKDYEQVQNLPVESNKVYYMQVYSQNKTYSSNSKYQVRAKITPSDDNYEPNNTRSTATIVIQMAAKGAIRSIDIISPDGKLYDTLYHIAPDAPYKISNAQAGEWTMIISAFTEEDVAALPRVQGSVIDSQDTVINSTVDMQLQISLMPSPVEIDIPNITADSYILEEFLADESIVVTENDQTLDKSLPLEDGIHELCVVREIDGLISEAREYSVTVDTTPPELSFADLPNETNRDRVVLFVNCSEAMSDLMINGTSVELFDCGAGDEYNDVYLLDHGDNYFDITVTDLAGNSSSQTICVTRTS